MTTLDHLGPRPAHPGEPAYAEATAVFNLSAVPRPATAVTARTVADVQSAVRAAATTGTPVRVHTTGHAAAGAAPVRTGLLIRTALAGPVTVDPARRLARIPAGTRWAAVVEAAARHGLAAPHGSSGTVGVVGYLLRGGLSSYGRWTGLASNSVRAIDLVDAAGRLHRVDGDSDPELLWALRGGGGGFGVVTAIELELFPADEVHTGAAYWPAAYAGPLLDRWLKWSAVAPWAATTSLRVMRLPALPDVPPELSAGPVLAIDGTVLGGGVPGSAEKIAAELLGPLRTIAEPLQDTWQTSTTAAVLQAHMDPSDPVPFQGDHMLLGELGDAGAEAFLRVCGAQADSPLIVSGLRQLGGAFAEPHTDGGALDRIGARFSYAGSGVPVDPATATALRDHCGRIRDALQPWNTGRTAPSFVESYEQPQGHLDDERAAKVAAVRSRVDPGGVFSGDVTPVLAPR